MRWSRYCIGDVSPGAAARFRASSLAMASLSKKSLRAAERKRADVARARRRWIREQGWLDTTRLVFIDETAVTTNMLRLNGWNSRGERLFADAPMGHWETVTFIAGLRQTGIVAPMLTKGAMNGEAFLAYIEQMPSDGETRAEYTLRLRQQHSLPVLATFKIWLDDHAAKVLPESYTGKAIAYARSQWDYLTRYTSDGRARHQTVCHRTKKL